MLGWKRVLGLVSMLLCAACSSEASGGASPSTDAGDDVAEGGDATDAATDPVPLDSGRPAVTIGTYPRVDGATATLPLAMVIACELLGMPYTWVEDSGGLTKQVVPAPTTSAQEALATEILARIVHHQTHPAYVNLIDDATDLILVASAPSHEELALAATAGVTLEWKPVALDALVFLVNAQNSVTGLSIDQIKKIYTGQITQWSDVGGPSAPIAPYQREANSGSQELMESLVMKGTPMQAWPDMVVYGMMGLINQVKSDPYGLGYSVFYYVTFIVPADGLGVLSIDGHPVSSATIGARTYPLVAETYVVTRTNLDHASLAWQLREWLLTPDGQGVVGESGYVPVGP